MPTSPLLIKEPPLLVLPSLAKAIGLNEAIVTQQLHYWLENQAVGIYIEDVKWVHNTYSEWQENFPFWSIPTIQRIFTSLENQQIVYSDQFWKHKHDQRKFYRINYPQLDTIDHIKLISSMTPKRYDVNRNQRLQQRLPQNSAEPRAPKANTIPELVLFRQVTGLYPPRANFDQVTQAIQTMSKRLGRFATAEDLLPWFQYWTAHIGKPTNLAWLLTYAGPGKQFTTGKRGTATQGAPTAQRRLSEAELEQARAEAAQE